MNYEIKKEDWANFLNTLGKRRFEWRTRIEVVSSEIGDQILADGLPLNGFTVEKKGDQMLIDISVGESRDAHQTHNIKNPLRVAYLPADDQHGDVIDIEEEDGTKTLITFIEPMGILVGFTYVEMAFSSAG
jgi:hypothetical protein